MAVITRYLDKLYGEDPKQRYIMLQAFHKTAETIPIYTETSATCSLTVLLPDRNSVLPVLTWD